MDDAARELFKAASEVEWRPNLTHLAEKLGIARSTMHDNWAKIERVVRLRLIVEPKSYDFEPKGEPTTPPPEAR